MGMSTHVVGFRPPDAHWKNMKAVWDACHAAKVDVPEAVEQFFAETEPDEAGVVVDLEKTGATQKWSDGRGCEGFQVDVSKLPEGLKIIRFYNAW